MESLKSESKLPGDEEYANAMRGIAEQEKEFSFSDLIQKQKAKEESKEMVEAEEELEGGSEEEEFEGGSDEEEEKDGKGDTKDKKTP